MSVKAIARLRVTIEIEATGPYGGDWSLADVQRDGKRIGLDNIRRALQAQGLKLCDEPKLIVLIVEEDDV